MWWPQTDQSSMDKRDHAAYNMKYFYSTRSSGKISELDNIVTSQRKTELIGPLGGLTSLLKARVQSFEDRVRQSTTELHHFLHQPIVACFVSRKHYGSVG